MMPKKDGRKEGEPEKRPPEEPRKPYKPPKVTDFGDLKDVTLGGGCGCGSGSIL